MQRQDENWNKRQLTFVVEPPGTPDGVLRFRLSGAITEDAAGPFDEIVEVVEKSPSKEVVLNLAGVSFMNSIGIQGWMQFQKRIGNAHQIFLEECAPEVVVHINLILGFASKASILSFHVPYACPKCRKSKSILARREEVSVDKYPSPPNCDCGRVMILEEPEEEFFRFLER